MMLGALLKRAATYFGAFLPIAFRDGPGSPVVVVKSLNITGFTNSSLIRSGTVFNASEISNFTISNFTVFNAITTYPSTVILPISLLPLFESATAASELQSALSTITISVSTSSIPDSHRASDSVSTASPTSHGVEIHPTPTISAAKATTGIGGTPTAPASLSTMSSSEPMRTSAKTTDFSIGTALRSSIPFLGLSTSSSAPSKTSAKLTSSSPKPTAASSKLAKAHANDTTVPRHEVASEHISSTISGLGFEIVTAWDMGGFPTSRTKTCWEPTSRSYDQRGSLVTTTPTHLPMCTPTSASSTHADHSKAGTSYASAYKASMPASKASGISAPRSSVGKAYRQSVGSGTGTKLPTGSLYNNATASSTSGIPKPGPSAPIWVPNLMFNSSSAVQGGWNYSSRNTTHASSKSFESMLEDVLAPMPCKRGISEEDPCNVPLLLASNARSNALKNSTSTQFSNSSDIASSNVAEDAGEMDNILNMDTIRNYCAANPSVGINPICKRLHSDPNITFLNLTKLSDPFAFNYVAYFNDLNNLGNFPDEPEIPDIVYFALNVENLRDSQTFEWYSGWTVLRQGSEDWMKHGEWQTFWKEFLHEPNFKCPDGMASCNYNPPTLEDILRRIPDNRPLARRVLFIALMLDMMHSYSNLLDERFAYAEEVLKTIVPEIVTSFTFQLDGDKKSKCDIIEAIVSTTINLVIDVSIGVLTDGIGAAITSQLNSIIERSVRKMMKQYQAREFARLVKKLGPSLKHIDFKQSGTTVRHSIEYLTKEIQSLEKMEGKAHGKLLKDLNKLGHMIPDEITEDLHLAVQYIKKHGTHIHMPSNKKATTPTPKDPGLGSNKAGWKDHRITETDDMSSIIAHDGEGLSMAKKLKSLYGNEPKPMYPDFQQESKKPIKKSQDEKWATIVGIIEEQKWQMPYHEGHKDNKGEPQTLDDRIMPYITNVMSQMAWNPMMHIPQNHLASYYRLGGEWFPKSGSVKESDFDWSLVGKAYRAWPANRLDEIQDEYREQAQAPLRGGHTDLPTIIGGKGSGWLCSDFEGDWKNLNEPNKDLLQKRIGMELDNGRRQVWTVFKEMYNGATPEAGKPSMVARWMLARKWVGKEEQGTVEYDLNHKEVFHKAFELDFVKEIASATLSQGHNYMKCSRRPDAVEKCTKIGDWYESFICPLPKTDPNLVCAVGRWYFSDWSPHEVEMNAIRSVEQFGAMRGFTFDKREMLQEMFDNYLKHGNNWGQKDWGIQSLDGGKHPRGWHIPVCMYAGNEYDVFEHQRPWWHNTNFPATCGDHHANETAGFMKAMNVAPGGGKHKAKDRTFTDTIPLILLSRSPYTRYVSMCNMGIRFPSSKDRSLSRAWVPLYGVQTSKDHIATLHNCGTPGHPACPEEEQPYGDQDCGMIEEATQHMTEDEGNVYFCSNACGHTVFTREVDQAQVRFGQTDKLPLPNFEVSCGHWLEQHGSKALERVSYRTLDDAEKGIVEKTLSGPMVFDYEKVLGDNYENVTFAKSLNGNSTV